MFREIVSCRTSYDPSAYNDDITDFLFSFGFGFIFVSERVHVTVNGWELLLALLSGVGFWVGWIR
jgi:hypothetical protein